MAQTRIQKRLTCGVGYSVGSHGKSSSIKPLTPCIGNAGVGGVWAVVEVVDPSARVPWREN